MAYPNPHYRPDWSALRAQHGAEMKEASEERDRLAKQDDIGSPAYQEAESRAKTHLHAYKETFRQQFPTVQEYAAWLFDTFDPTRPVLGDPFPLPSVDIAAFRTVEEADAEWSRIRRIVEKAEIEAEGSLKVGQPPGLLAFADASRVRSYWRQFTGQDLYPGGYRTEDICVSALVTVDELEDGWHICFMHDPSNYNTGIVGVFERLATVIYREARQIAE